MAIISITATEFGGELIAGIPQFISLQSNIPSTMYYTLDGTEPTILSSVYVEYFGLPTEDFTTRLRVFAVSGADSGTLDVSFKSDKLPTFSSKQPRIIIDGYDVENVYEDGYELNSDYVADTIARGYDYDLQDLDLKFSKTDHLGNPPGVFISIGFPNPTVFNEEKSIGVDFQASSPNNQNVFFNPRSLYIIMDGRDDDQVNDGYRIINRPNSGTMDVVRYLGGKLLYEPNPYISGGLVRYFEDHKKGIRVSYYFDHNETRWIKSIQTITKTIPRDIGRRPATMPFVVKWIQNRRSMI